eukprot:1158636-Pelagomonas_calceolata.AAC.5
MLQENAVRPYICSEAIRGAYEMLHNVWKVHNKVSGGSPLLSGTQQRDSNQGAGSHLVQCRGHLQQPLTSTSTLAGNSPIGRLQQPITSVTTTLAGGSPRASTAAWAPSMSSAELPGLQHSVKACTGVQRRDKDGRQRKEGGFTGRAQKGQHETKQRGHGWRGGVTACISRDAIKMHDAV